MPEAVKDIGASVRARLLRISNEKGRNFDLVLTHYAIERLLYRLAKSRYADRFVLKGAKLLVTWFDEPFAARTISIRSAAASPCVQRTVLVSCLPKRFVPLIESTGRNHVSHSRLGT